MSIAIKELIRQPGRFVSVGGALTLLVVLLVVLGGFLDGLELNQTGPYRAHEDRLLVFSEDSELLIQRSRVDDDQAELLAAADGVAGVGALNLVPSTAVSGEGDILDIVLFGYDLETDALPPAPGDGTAVIDEALARRSGIAVGDTVLIGATSEPVVVSQIVEDLSQGAPTVWLSTADWRRLVAVGNPAALPPEGVNEALVIEPAPGTDPGLLARRLEGTDGIDGIAVATATEAIEALPVVQQQSSTFEGIIGVTFIVTLLVVALFFALITLERVDLYAVLKALGARTGDLLAGVSAQAVGVSVVALVLGFGLSLIFAALIPDELPIRLEPVRLAQIAVGVLLTALIGSLFTLRRILRIDPAEAIG